MTSKHYCSCQSRGPSNRQLEQKMTNFRAAEFNAWKLPDSDESRCCALKNLLPLKQQSSKTHILTVRVRAWPIQFCEFVCPFFLPHFLPFWPAHLICNISAEMSVSQWNDKFIRACPRLVLFQLNICWISKWWLLVIFSFRRWPMNSLHVTLTRALFKRSSFRPWPLSSN